MKIDLKIDYIDGFVKIENDSDRKLVLSKKIKRTVRDLIVIKPNYFMILEGEFDIGAIYFRFEEI